MKKDIVKVDSNGNEFNQRINSCDDDKIKVDGPAVEYPDGEDQWYRNGKYYKVNKEDGPIKETVYTYTRLN